MNSFTRLDGSTAVVGEPLVKKRFPLNRLAWITYKGPSSNNMSDPAVQQTITALGGDPTNTNDPAYVFVSQGTVSNISNAFGLTWHSSPSSSGVGGYWTYDVHTNTAAAAGHPGTIATLSAVAQQGMREPDFFELLQAAICCGSLGTTSPYGSTGGQGATPWGNAKDAQVGVQVLQIGANIIDQVSPVLYPTHIVFNNGTYTYSLWGSTDLPYFSDFGNVAIAVRNSTSSNPTSSNPVAFPPGASNDIITDPGLGVILCVPAVWDPYAYNTNYVIPTGGAPSQLRIVISSSTLDSPTTPYNLDDQIIDTVYQTNGNGSVNPTTWSVALPAAPWTQDSVNTTTGVVNTTNSPNYINFTNWSSASGAAVTNLYRQPNALFRSGDAAKANVYQLAKEVPNNLFTVGSNASSNGILELSGESILGFLVATNPVRPMTSSSNPCTTNYPLREIPANNGASSTISLEYQTSDGFWIPYQQVDRVNNYAWSYMPATWTNTGTTITNNAGLRTTIANNGYNFQGESYWQATAFSDQWWATYSIDPRTGRFPAWKDQVFGPALYSQVNANGTTNDFINGSTYGTAGTTLKPGINEQIYAFGYPSDSVQNLYSASYHIVDPDGVVRRGMAGYQSGSTSTTGIPLTTVSGPTDPNAANRPIVLHRPFRSVAELGYVFSDTPWKNIDFFSPESGDGALLDTFCIAEDDTPNAVVAGRVDLNTRQTNVLSALLSGAYRDQLNPTANPLSTNPPPSPSEVAAIAQALINRTSGNTASGFGPLANLADLVGRYVPGYTNDNGQPFDGFSADLGGAYNGGASSSNSIIQRYRETAMRALTDSGQAGTWNLMIDLVAQIGKYPPSATTVNQFRVEGETRYWIHLSIDRQTGKVIDQLLEVVNE